MLVNMGMVMGLMPVVGIPLPFISYGGSSLLAISIGMGMIPLIAPNFKQWMPHGLHPLIESGILLASISAVALNVFFNGASADTSAAIAAAKQADAH